MPLLIAAALAAPGPTDTRAETAYVMAAVGLSFGPSLGHLYAGQPLRAAATGLLRGTISTVATIVAFTTCPLENCTSQEERTFVVAMGAGMILNIGLGILDYATLGSSVRKHNSALAISPVIRTGGAGLMATVRF